MEIHNCDKFHLYSIYGYQFKNFQRLLDILSIHVVTLLVDFFGPYSPKYCLILLRSSPEVVLIQKQAVFQESLNNANFYGNGAYSEFTLLVQL